MTEYYTFNEVYEGLKRCKCPSVVTLSRVRNNAIQYKLSTNIYDMEIDEEMFEKYKRNKTVHLISSRNLSQLLEKLGLTITVHTLEEAIADNKGKK
jgi:hypothetical protein